MTALNDKGDFRDPPHQYEVVSARGNVSSIRFNTAAEAADYATQCWPNQEQDPDRTGKGWDIQIVGVE